MSQASADVDFLAGARQPVVIVPIERQLGWPALMLFGLSYGLLALISLELSVKSIQVAVLWLPSGLLVGLLATQPVRSWWRVLLVMLPCHVLPNLMRDRSFGLALLYATVNFAEALTAAALLRRFGGVPVGFGHVRDVLARLVPAGALGAIVGAVLLALLSPEGLRATSTENAIVWFAAVMLGVLVVAPIVVPLLNRSARSFNPHVAGVIESVALLLVLGLGALLVFARTGGTSTVPLLFVPFPVLIWSALRAPIGVTALATLLLTAVAGWFTVRGEGPLLQVAPDLVARVLWLQGYVLVAALMSLLISACVEDRRLAMQALAEREAQYALITHHASDSIALSEAGGGFIFVSPAVKHLYGYTVDELVGRNPYDLMHPDDRPVAESAMAGLRSTGLPTMFRCRWRRRDGTWVWLESSIALVDGPEPLRERATVSVTRNVTQQRALEHELSRVHRLDSIGRMAAGLAHDFNNVLAVMAGSAQVALSDMTDDSQYFADFTLINETAKRGRQITRQLMNIGRESVPMLTRSDGADIVRQALPAMQAVLGTAIDVEAEFTATERMVRVDEGQLNQVLLNLAANARDAMPNGGVLRVMVANAAFAETDEARPLALAVGRYLTIAVSDSGPGVPESLREEIFEPFMTSKTAEFGTGLGLASAVAVAAQHGGHIWCESVNGGGACFVLALPLYTADPDDVFPSAREAPHPQATPAMPVG